VLSFSQETFKKWSTNLGKWLKITRQLARCVEKWESVPQWGLWMEFADFPPFSSDIRLLMELFIIRREPGTATAWLDAEEARHAIKSLRLKPGDRAIGTDGVGAWLVCRIVALGRDQVELEVVEERAEVGEKPQRVGMALSVLHKPDRMEWFMEKSVELGVTDIFPYVGKRTVKTGFREDRMEKILVAALKQCLRTRLPKLHEVMDFPDLLEVDRFSLRILAQGDVEQPLGRLQERIAQAPSVLGIIGPEGDFAPDELAAAKQAGVELVRLGNNRLRSETAAIHLLSSFKLMMNY
jgi:16S rRNA (uracil1498-N3)-methyltransferase